MTNYSIRVLTAEDIDLMRSMLLLFGEAFDEHETYVERQPDDAYLRALLASDTFLAIAAIADGTVVGGLAGYLLSKFEQARSEFYIYDLAVDAGHRRRGIATSLIEELRQSLVGRGVHAIFVQADHGDDPAVALYTGLGTREDVMHFDIPPIDPPRR